MDTLPRTRASQNRWATTEARHLGGHLRSVRRSSCLRLQLFGVETFLLLPQCQSNGRDLSCHRQSRHLRLLPFVQQRDLELTQRTHTTTGSGGGSFEDLFHFVVVIPLESTNLLRFFRTLQLSVHPAVFRTVARLNA